ncbi:putative transposase [Nitrococcus mobilis Nb-231]|uniref:Putative transposase n=1 Tax=Nitrococcus mobilis Nb-231 TaxID=314278 RepID=A4BLU5_9GAMM|nr:putative transposase [Nitrococcus mobilis Nb-231]
MCRVLDVSPSGYYAWRNRTPSVRSATDAALTERIEAIHQGTGETYGAPRIHAALRDESWCVGRKRIARLMSSAGLQGITRRKGTFTTERDKGRRSEPDLVERDFTADAPNELYVFDTSYIPTWGGFLYLAVVLDVLSRRIVGWSMATHLKSQLVVDALDMALCQRQPEGVIHHSDQGCQLRFKELSRRWRASVDGLGR